ncbi:MAG: LLM class F420-dependent oxidoreductase [Chloroflexi bacterium]|nr:LLM class F420-dependent oxidoreductase [Chloroflexota bacterium]
MDHFFQIRYNGPPEDPLLEAYTFLGFLAGVTQRVKLGALVTGVIYRLPGLLIKQVTTLDVLSGGRVYLGIGAAWYEREAKGLGFPFPPLKERFERLEETLQIAHQLWSGEVQPYAGQHYHLAEPIISPRPINRPHPPILIGGQGEKKTLRLVAQYADAYNCNVDLSSPEGLETVRRKLDVLKQHCDEVGRDYATIEKTGLMNVDLAQNPASAKEVIAKCEAAAQIGIQHIIFGIPKYETAALEIFGREIIPQVAAL